MRCDCAQLNDVAAHWVLQPDAGGSVGEIAGMTGILKMIQELGGVHARIVTGHDALNYQKFRLNSLLE